MEDQDTSVDKIFLVGSYANGKATIVSDLDLLVQLRGPQVKFGKFYPPPKKMEEIKSKLLSHTSRVHIIYGTQEAQESLYKKHGWAYREIPLGGLNADTRGSGSKKS